MSTTVVYYPHAIYAPGILTLTQLSDMEPGHNFQDLTEYSSCQVGPQFTGTHQASPDNRFSTSQIKSVLDACVAGDLNISRDLSGGNVDTEYKAGLNLASRIADAELSHLRLRMQENAMLCWEELTARQGAVAELRCRLAAIYDAAGGNDPLVPTAGVGLATVADVAHLYTLGPIKLNGSFVEGVVDSTLNNNIEYEEVHSAGDGFLSYLGIKRYRPVLTFRTRNSAVLATYGTRGTALSALRLYYRKKLASGINVADATTEHIAVIATVGTIKARKISSQDAVAEVTVDLKIAAQNTAAYSIDTAIAIT